MLLVVLLPLFAMAEIDFDHWNRIESIKYENTIDTRDLELYIPADDLAKVAVTKPNTLSVGMRTDIDDLDAEQEREEKVGKKIMDHTFKNFAKGKFTPNASIFRTVKNLEESMKYDISIPKSSKDGVDHKFNLQYQPFQSLAKVKYSGFLHANLEYYFSDSKLECSVEKSLNNDLYVALTHGNDAASDQSGDNISMFLMKWELK